MRLLRNSGTDRALDLLREWLTPGAQVDIVSSSISLLAFAELKDSLERVDRCRLVLGEPNSVATSLLGGDADIAFRGRLQGRWLARVVADWIGKKAEIRNARKAPPQSLIFVRGNPSPGKAMMGSCSFTTEGLGLTPGGLLGLVQATDVEAEATSYAEWFESNWSDLRAERAAKDSLLVALEDMASQRAPSLVYFQVLYQMFKCPPSGPLRQIWHLE